MSARGRGRAIGGLVRQERGRLPPGARVPPGGLSSDGTHLARRGNEVRGVDLMAGPLRPQIPANRALEIVIAAAIPQNPAHIRLLDGKQAVAQLAVRSQPQTIAIAAERL